MAKEKYSKMITVPIRQEMLSRIQEICEKEDIPISVLMRDAIKLMIQKTEKKHGIKNEHKDEDFECKVIIE